MVLDDEMVRESPSEVLLSQSKCFPSGLRSEMDTQPRQSVTAGYLSKGSPRKSAVEQPCLRNE